jgi:hypothetical protein
MATAVNSGPRAVLRAANEADPLLVLLRELAEGQRALAQRVAALEAIGRSRDAADAVLRRQLVDSTRGLPFGAADLLRHAHVDEALRRALLGADVVTTSDVGCWLRDHRGVDDGVSVVRGRNRRWQVRHVTCGE